MEAVYEPPPSLKMPSEYMYSAPNTRFASAMKPTTI